MSVQFELTAESREQTGTSESRRFRRGGKVPAVLYGAGKDNQNLLLDHLEVLRNLEVEAFHSAVITIKTAGGDEQAILRDVQMHPYRPQVQHVDFQRVSATETLRMKVPLHFIGGDASPGVKVQGGIISHLMNEVEIACLPSQLPEYLEVDVSELNLHESVKLTDIKLPEGVELLALAHGGEDQTIASVLAPKVIEEIEEEAGVEAAEAEAEAAEAEAPGEPEAEEGGEKD
jgi:large subunit ribosomal protein L25